MKEYSSVHPKFLIDDEGKKIGVLLDMKEFDSLIEEIEDLHDVIKSERVIESNAGTHTLEELEEKYLGKDD